MNVLHKFLINIICFFKNILKKHDYTIISRELEYWVEHGEDYITDDETFWEEQSNEWDGETDAYIVSLTGDEKVPPPPDVVTKMLFRVKYWYNNHVYKYLTYDRDYKWPPHTNKSMRFNIPLLSAKLLNAEGTPVKDILGKIKRYAGPRGDFYEGEKIKIADMLYYDEETLKEMFPKILIRNIFGKEKVVSTVDGYITDLHVP